MERTAQCDSLKQSEEQLKQKLEATEKRLQENKVLILEREKKREGRIVILINS